MQEQVGIVTVVPVCVDIEIAVTNRNVPLQDQVVHPLRRARQRVAVDRNFRGGAKRSRTRADDRVERRALRYATTKVVAQVRIVDLGGVVAGVGDQEEVVRDQDFKLGLDAVALDAVGVQQLIDVGCAARCRELLVVIDERVDRRVPCLLYTSDAADE